MLKHHSKNSAGPHAERTSTLLSVSLGQTHGKSKYFAALALVCFIAFASISLIFLMRGRSLIWELDGKNLYYTFFAYEGELLRAIASSFFTGGSFDFSTYTFNAGFGDDAYLLLAGHITDPLNLLSAFCPPDKAEYLYEFLIFVRFYMAAVAFSLFCFSRGKSKDASLCASLAYVLCGYVVMLAAFRHAFFINFAILLPLIFMGADRLFTNKSPWLFIGAFAVSFIYSVYTSYMACIFLLVYCLIVYFAFPRRRSVGDFALLVAKFAGCLVLGFLLSAVLSLPSITSLLSMERIGMERPIPFFQTLGFYEQLAANITGGSASYYCTIIGVVPTVSIFAVLAAGKLINKPERLSLLIGVALCLAGICIAYVGSVMNGFGYSTDRWQIIWGVCGAYAVALALPALRHFALRNWVRLDIGLALLLAFLLLTPTKKLQFWVVFAIIAVILAGAVTVTFLRGRQQHANNTKRPSRGCRPFRHALPIAVTFLLIGSSTASYDILLSRHGYGTLSTFMRSGTLYDYTHAMPLEDHLDEIDTNYRIDRSDISTGRNVSFGLGYKGMDYYSSMYNQNLDNFRRDMGIADNATNFIYNGVQGRLALDAILGARYYIASQSTLDTVPYGYRKLEDLGESVNGNTYYLYESSAALPLAFVYDSVIPFSTYEALTPPEKQEAITRACVLEESEAEADALPLSLQTTAEEATVSTGEGATLRDGHIIVTKKDAAITIAVAGETNCENYLFFSGLAFHPMSQSTAQELARDKNASLSYKDFPESSSFKPAGSSRISVESGETYRSFNLLSPYDGQYGGKSEWAVNLGYSEKPLSEITITFGEVGDYDCSSIYFARQPVAPILENLSVLQKANTATIEFLPTGVDIDVGASQTDKDNERFVFVSLPYSDGWSATLDGQPVEIEKANVGFMAIPVDDSAHTITMRYSTPGLRTGARISFITICAFVVFFAGRSLQRRKRG